MDRDKRWDRIKIAVDGLVQGKGDKVEGDLISTIEKGYENGVTDEFIKPIISGSADSRIKSEQPSRVHRGHTGQGRGHADSA